MSESRVLEMTEVDRIVDLWEGVETGVCLMDRSDASGWKIELILVRGEETWLKLSLGNNLHIRPIPSRKALDAFEHPALYCREWTP